MKMYDVFILCGNLSEVCPVANNGHGDRVECPTDTSGGGDGREQPGSAPEGPLLHPSQRHFHSRTLPEPFVPGRFAVHDPIECTAWGFCFLEKEVNRAQVKSLAHDPFQTSGGSQVAA